MRKQHDSSIATEIAQILAIADELTESELGFDEVEAAGLDGTGRDGNPRFPYTWDNLTDTEKDAVRAFWLSHI